MMFAGTLAVAFLAACETPPDASTTGAGSGTGATTKPSSSGPKLTTKPSASSNTPATSASTAAPTASTAPPPSGGLTDKPWDLAISGKPVAYTQGVLTQDSFGYVSIKFGEGIDCKKTDTDSKKTPELEIKLGKTNPTGWANSQFSAHFQIFDANGQHNGVDPAYLQLKLPAFKMDDKELKVILSADTTLDGKPPITVKGGGGIKVEICSDKPWDKLKSLPASFDGELSGTLDGKPFAPKSVFATVATDPATKAEWVTGIWFFEKEGNCEKVVTDLQTKAFGKKILITAKGLQKGNPMLGGAAPADASFSEVNFLGGVLKITELSDLKEGDTLKGAFAADNFAEKPAEASSMKGKFEAKVCRFK
jgi:hypothetical protein